MKYERIQRIEKLDIFFNTDNTETIYFAFLLNNLKIHFTLHNYLSAFMCIHAQGNAYAILKCVSLNKRLRFHAREY